MPEQRCNSQEISPEQVLPMGEDVLRNCKQGSGGEGWQIRVDTALRDWLKTHSPA
jgi:uncharacterized protein (DUF4415 family)